MPRPTALRGLKDPLIDDAALIEIALVFPDLAPQCEARLTRRANGYERDIRGPWLFCAHCNQAVPTRAVAIQGTAHWLCLKKWHVLAPVADLAPFGVCINQLPVWAATAATGTPETEPGKGSSHE